MSHKRLIGVVAVVAALGVTGGVLGAGLATGAEPAAAPVQYSAKFVCGFVPESELHDYPVKPGNYATVINVHNWTAAPVRTDMRVALGYPVGAPVPPVILRQKVVVNKYRVGEVDCPTIWAWIGVPAATFVEGMIHIGAPFEVPVAAVYTSQTDLVPQAPGDPGAGISIDVEYLEPMTIAF